jgi:hypothetical protein
MTPDEPEVVEGELVEDDATALPVLRHTAMFELDQRRAQAYAASKYWPDAASLAQAFVKIEAGRELGLPAIVAMSEVHVIQGKPTLGAGALATLIKTSGRYDYRVIELNDERCALRFLDVQAGDLGESVFTIEDARKAGLAARSTWRQYPRNMLFARALSNGVAWFCPDVTTGRVYVPEELDGVVPETPPTPAAEPVEQQETEVRSSAGPIPDRLKPMREQLEEIKTLIRSLDKIDSSTDWKARCTEITGVPWSHATTTVAANLIRRLRDQLSDLMNEANESPAA